MTGNCPDFEIVNQIRQSLEKGSRACQMRAHLLIGIKLPGARKGKIKLQRRSADLKVPEPPEKRTDQRISRPTSARGAVSAVKISEKLTTEIDAWAEAHGMARSDAICRLVEIGLNAEPAPLAAAAKPLDLEDLAVKQISQLLDPALPADERERRIRRLTEGPPEFTAERIDLPKPRK